MKAAIWFTGHEIADTVAEALAQGLGKSIAVDTLHTGDPAALGAVPAYDAHIGYGVLRGMGGVFGAAAKAKIPWFNIDRGYWGPGHYAGLYRISLNGTQQTTGLGRIAPDYERLAKLEVGIEPAQPRTGKTYLMPPTQYVCGYLGLSESTWLERNFEPGCVIKPKDGKPVDWQDVGNVVTFNSAMGWEALRRGIPVVSDETHSFVGAYQKQVDKMPHLDANARRRMFAVQASLQLSLKEIRQGYAWPLIARLLSMLAGTPAKA